ncbi:MAG TPA: hypothetical protein VHA13_01115, partial [Gammaproteobacteria bacterium]|nr:hypothetical protein [Gammaproteobacteria bacterium]
MTSFGKGEYIPPYIKGKDGILFSTRSLSNETAIEILSTPDTTSTSHLAQSLIYRTLLEFNQQAKSITSIPNIIYEDEIILNKSEYQEYLFGKNYFHLYLPDLKQLEHYHQKILDEQGNLIATVLMLLHPTVKFACHVCVISNQPLIISGNNLIYSLSIYSSDDLIINDNLEIEEKIFIHGKSILMPSQLKISAKQITLESEQQYSIASFIKGERVDIKAGNYLGTCDIEADQISIITEEGENYSLIKARENLSLVALNWTNQPGSQIHSPGQTSIIAH